MNFLKFSGTIEHIFDVKSYAINEIQHFSKKKFIISTDNGLFTICLVQKKIELFEYCRVGSIIDIEVMLKGRMWEHQGQKYSENELVCSKLEIVKNTQFNYLVNYKNTSYNIKKYYDEDGCLRLNLVDIFTKYETEFTVNHEKSHKKNIVLISDRNKDLMLLLAENGLLEPLYHISESGGFSGCYCKILVIDSFKENNMLFSLIKDIRDLIDFRQDEEDWYDNIQNNSENAEVDYYNDDLDLDQQSEEFYNQE